MYLRITGRYFLSSPISHTDENHSYCLCARSPPVVMDATAAPMEKSD